MTPWQLVLVHAFFISSVVAQGLSVWTPGDVVVCQPVALAWSEGSAPYSVNIYPGLQFNASSLRNLGQHPNNFTWVVDIAAGTSVAIAVRDSAGLVGYSGAFTINAGVNNSCVVPINSGIPSPSPQGAKKSATPTGAIIGGVVGGVVALAIIIWTIVFYRQRSIRNVESGRPDENSGVPITEQQSLSPLTFAYSQPFTTTPIPDDGYSPYANLPISPYDGQQSHNVHKPTDHQSSGPAFTPATSSTPNRGGPSIVGEPSDLANRPLSDSGEDPPPSYDDKDIR